MLQCFLVDHPPPSLSFWFTKCRDCSPDRSSNQSQIHLSVAFLINITKCHLLSKGLYLACYEWFFFFFFSWLVLFYWHHVHSHTYWEGEEKKTIFRVPTTCQVMCQVCFRPHCVDSDIYLTPTKDPQGDWCDLLCWRPREASWPAWGSPAGGWLSRIRMPVSDPQDSCSPRQTSPALGPTRSL